MNDKYLVIKFLIKNIKDDHLAVYLYSCGHLGTKSRAVKHVMEILAKIFNTFEPKFLMEIVEEYLSFKRYQYIKGEIKIKKIYFPKI